MAKGLNVLRAASLIANIAFGLGAAPAAAEGGPDPERVQRLVAAMVQQDCLLTAQTAAEALEAAELSEEDAALALARLVDQGQAKVVPEGWRLLPPTCPKSGT